jgi:hypothetical protein
MATTGERLVELSGLPTGTALDHLLAIETGGGTGTGETIYVDRIAAELADAVLGTVAEDSIRATIHDDQEAELADDIQATVTDEIEGEVI